MIEVRLVETEDDLVRIKKLQLLNLPRQLSSTEKESQGFVTCEYSVEDLKIMNSPYPHVIATENENVIAYCLVMMQHHKEIMPILLPMFDQIDQARSNHESLRDRSYFVMGQVCVSKEFRGQNIFYKMYDFLRDKMCHSFDLVITEISEFNTRSIRAHQNQGFKSLLNYEAPDGYPWSIVYWNWT